jgi:hypothetical protein
MSTRTPIVLTQSMRTLAGTKTRWFSLTTTLVISCLGPSLSAQQMAELATATMPEDDRWRSPSIFRGPRRMNW